jgi:multicomponent Na+:H+ antiporter subunit B
MYSLILHTATRYLLPLLLLFSLFLLFRGHNELGGGFVGGLVAASAFALYLIAHDKAETQRVLRFDSKLFLGVGLGLATASGILALLFGRPFLTAVWDARPIPVIGKLGTPLLFDVGVYLVVFGVVMTIVLSLAED